MTLRDVKLISKIRGLVFLSVAALAGVGLYAIDRTAMLKAVSTAIETDHMDSVVWLGEIRAAVLTLRVHTLSEILAATDEEYAGAAAKVDADLQAITVAVEHYRRSVVR